MRRATEGATDFRRVGLEESVGLRRPRFFLVIVALSLLAVFFAPRAAHAAPGDVKWRFEVGGQYILQPPAVAPDGSVAVVGSSGTPYSLTRTERSGGRCLASEAKADRASARTGRSCRARRTHHRGRAGRDDSVDSYRADRRPGRDRRPDGRTGREHLRGPDLGGLGAYALSPAGDLLWNNPGDPNFLEYGQLGAEIVFGSGRLFASFDEFPAEQSAMMYGLTVGGTQDWAVAVPDANDIFMQRQAQPAVGPGGSLYLTGFSGQSGWALVRFDQSTGSVVWTYTRSPANGMSPPSVGPRRLDLPLAEPQLSRRRQPGWGWPLVVLRRHDHRPAPGEPRREPRRGGRSTRTSESRALLRGWDAVDGTPAFTTELPTGDSGFQIVYTPPRFSAGQLDGVRRHGHVQPSRDVVRLRGRPHGRRPAASSASASASAAASASASACRLRLRLRLPPPASTSASASASAGPTATSAAGGDLPCAEGRGDERSRRHDAWFAGAAARWAGSAAPGHANRAARSSARSRAQASDDLRERA